MIDGRHVSSVLDILIFRGSIIYSHHYLVAAKIRRRLRVAKNARQYTQGRFDVENLQAQLTAERFSIRLAHLLFKSIHQYAQHVSARRGREQADRTRQIYEKMPKPNFQNRSILMLERM